MPQSIDPNRRADPITALSLAVANVHAEREQYRALIRKYWQLQVAWDTGSTNNDEEYHDLHCEVLRETMTLLGDM